MLRNIYLGLLFSLFHSFNSQTISDPCGSMEYEKVLIQNDTLYEQYRDYLNINSSLFIQNSAQKALDENSTYDEEKIIFIPVVVHLIGSDVISLIGFTKVQEQIDILNQDFGRYPATPGYGNGVDTKVRFCLAKKDYNGNPTNGIVYVSGDYSDYEWDYKLPNSDLSSDFTLKGLSHWDAKKYLNIYVVEKLAAYRAAYSSFPAAMAGSSALDGVVVLASLFGNNSSTNYGLGRVTTHEVGHWLGLYHPWEREATGTPHAHCVNSNPSWDNDMVEDTPPVYSPNANCNYISNTCHTDMPDMPDLVNNYMEYTPDNCRNMFTQGQANRIRTPIRDISLFGSCSESCNNNIQDGDETGIDCGGEFCNPCVSHSGGGFGCSKLSDYWCTTDYDNTWWNNDQSCKSISFKVNGRKSNDFINVCKSNIILNPTLGGWLFASYESNYLCTNTSNMWQAAKKIYNGIANNKCHCVWFSLLITITECDANKSPIAGPFSEEKYFYDNDQSTINELGTSSIDLNNYLPTGFQFQDGKYYFVTLSTTNKCWSNPWNLGISSSAYIQTYHPNLNVQNATISSSQVADDIILNNCNVNVSPAINVVAKNSILIINNSLLKRGHYYIDANMNCNNILQYRETNNQQIPTKSELMQDQIQVNNESTLTLPVSDNGLNKDGSFAVKYFGMKGKISMYPNPADENVNIKFNNDVETEVFITLCDINGKEISSISFEFQSGDSSAMFNLKDYLEGIYFLTIKDHNGVILNAFKLIVVH